MLTHSLPLRVVMRLEVEPARPDGSAVLQYSIAVTRGFVNSIHSVTVVHRHFYFRFRRGRGCWLTKPANQRGSSDQCKDRIQDDKGDKLAALHCSADTPRSQQCTPDEVQQDTEDVIRGEQAIAREEQCEDNTTAAGGGASQRPADEHPNRSYCQNRLRNLKK